MKEMYINIKNINFDMMLCVYSMYMRIWIFKLKYMGRFIIILLKGFFISYKIVIF